MQNHGLTIYISDNDDIDLRHILNLIGESGKFSTWKISDVECFGESAEILHNISDEQKEISGEDFYEIASGIYQTIDGEFDAYKSKENNRWLRIKFIRGSEFDIETEDFELLNKFRNFFHNVKDLIY